MTKRSNDAAPTQTGNYAIETHNLIKVYGDGASVRALGGVSLRVSAGEFVTIMGPSGSGKSTLLNLLGALDRPTSGDVYINGHSLSSIRNLDAFRAQTVGFVFQIHNLIPTLTALENIEVPMMGQIRGRAQRRKHAEELLDLVNLQQRAQHLPGQLSGGQCQRVAVARALANQPAVVLADEPTGNLDSQAGADVISLLRDLNRRLGTTIVVVTHDVSVARQTDRVILLQDGMIADDRAVGHPYDEDLKAFRHSGLGQALESGDPQARAWLAEHGLTPSQQAR